MSKSKLVINITSEGQTGRVDIIGQISEWSDNNAMDFRTRCQNLKDAGVTNVLVYLMTVGGDCFQANEIVNILKDIFGKYNCEGGALVASAGAFIVAQADYSEQANNGQFMIHKPSGCVGGNDTEIENYLQLLRNMTSDYYDVFVAKCKKPKADFDAKWNGGDFWMSAKEAVEWGFINKTKEALPMPEPAQAKLKMSANAAGISPEELINIYDNVTNKTENKMNELSATALQLGLPVDATQAQINEKLAAINQKAADYDNLKAQVDKQKSDKQKADIKAKLDAAEKDKRITADVRANWQAAFEKDFEGTAALLDNMKPVVALSNGLMANGVVDTTYQGKTFEQLQDENPKLLAKLMNEDKDTYDALYNGFLERNGLKE